MGVKQSKRSVDITTAVEDGDHAATAGVIHMHEDGAKAALNGNAPAPTTPVKDAAAEDVAAKKKAADGVHQENGAGECDGVGGEGANHVANGEAEADEGGAGAKGEATEGADSGKKKKKEKKVKKKWSLRSISFSRKDRTKPQQQVQPPADASKDENGCEEATQKDAAEAVAEGEQKEPEKADGVTAEVPAQQEGDKGEPKVEVVEEKQMNGGASSEVKERGDAESQQADAVASVEAATPSTAVASPTDREDGDEVPPPLPTTPPPTEPQAEEAASSGGDENAAKVPADTSTVACATVEAVVPPCSKVAEGTTESPAAPEEPTVHSEEEAPVKTDLEVIAPIANEQSGAGKDIEEQEVVAQKAEVEEESPVEAPKEEVVEEVQKEEAEKEVVADVQEEVVEDVKKEEAKVVEAPEEEAVEEKQSDDALVVPPLVNILPPSPAPQPEEPTTETQVIESTEQVVDGSPETSEVVVSKIEECSKVIEETKTELTQEIQGEE